MANSQVQEGIIGFFDILGYQSFLENNEAQEAVDSVLNILINIEDQIPNYLIKKMSSIAGNDIKELLDKFNWLVFSDTILLTYPDDPSENVNLRFVGWLIFLSTSLALNRYMFESGLPLRGVVTTGKFVLRKHCFAGHSIVEAYREVQNLDVALTVFSEKAKQTFFNILKATGQEKDAEIIPGAIIEYLVPLNHAPPKKYSTLNFWAVPSLTKKFNGWDMRQIVYESFWGHKKDISPEAESKLKHTEQYLRYVHFKKSQL